MQTRANICMHNSTRKYQPGIYSSECSPKKGKKMRPRITKGREAGIPNKI
uniref:Uncharacterized protein n=1 Tax=Arundo donax TaxID=35708 RepID=A0A0A9C835_ARUDO